MCPLWNPKGFFGSSTRRCKQVVVGSERAERQQWWTRPAKGERRRLSPESTPSTSTNAYMDGNHLSPLSLSLFVDICMHVWMRFCFYVGVWNHFCDCKWFGSDSNKVYYVGFMPFCDLIDWCFSKLLLWNTYDNINKVVYFDSAGFYLDWWIMFQFFEVHITQYSYVVW